MPSSESTVRLKADLSQFKSEMQAAERQIKLVNSEFKAATAGMGDWSKSAEGLQAKIKQLNGVLEGQNEKLALLKRELSATVAVYGENSAAADRVRIKINEQEAAIARTESELKIYGNQLEHVDDEQEDVAQSAENLGDGFSVMKGALASLVADGIRAAIDGLKDLAKSMVQTGMSFESSLSNVEAISGATAQEMDLLKQKAQELGESTKFTASEVADAYGYMAMAGWKTEDMLGGIDGILQLSAASGADLATTSDIVTDALTAMGYAAQDAGHLADVMAAASSNANTNVEMMGATFQYAAPLAGALGYNMEDVAVAIGLMANAGIKGDKAGTALRSMFTRLSAPTKESATAMEALGLSITKEDGTMRSLADIVGELREKFANLNEEEQAGYAKALAGQNAISGFLALVNAAPEDFDKLTRAVKNSAGAAESMASTMQDNVGGQITILQSKIEGLMIKFYDKLAPTFRKAIDSFSEALDQIDWDKVSDMAAKFVEKAIDWFTYIVHNGDRVKTILRYIGEALALMFVANKINATANALTAFLSIMMNAESVTAGLSAVMSALGISMSAIPIVALTVGIVAAVEAFRAYQQKCKEIAEENYKLSDAQNELKAKIDETASAMEESAKRRAETGASIDEETQNLQSLVAQYNDVIDENGKVIDGYQDFAATIKQDLAEALGIAVEDIDKNIDANGRLGSSIDDLIQKKQLEAKIMAYEEDYQNAQKKRTELAQEMVQAWNDVDEAMKKVRAAEAEVLSLQNSWATASSDAEAIKKKYIDLPQAQANVEAARKAYIELRNTYDQTHALYEENLSFLNNYEEALTQQEMNNADGVNDALLKAQYNLKNHRNATGEELRQQVVDAKAYLTEMASLFSKGYIDDAALAESKKKLELAKGEVDKFYNDIGASTTQAQKDFGEGIKGFTDTASNGMKAAGEAAIEGLSTLGNWDKAADEMAKKYSGGINKAKPEMRSAGEASAKEVIEGAKEAAEDSKEAATVFTEKFVEETKNQDNTFRQAGHDSVIAAYEGATEAASEAQEPGEKFTGKFVTGVESKKDDAKAAGESIATESKTGSDSVDTEETGQNFAQGFINGINSKAEDARKAGINLSNAAKAGTEGAAKIESPSKVMKVSGEFFGEGFTLGIKEAIPKAVSAAVAMTKDSIKAVRETQKEGSPSKLTYESGRNFTQGFINGIASLQSTVVSTAKDLVNSALSELLKINDFNFSEAVSNASNVFSTGLDDKISYTINRMQYENEQKLKDFDETITSLQDQSTAAVEQVKNSKKYKKQQEKIAEIQKKLSEAQAKGDKKKAKKLQKQLTEAQQKLDQMTQKVQEKYDQQIQRQEEMRDAYQQASATMMEQFSTAINEYQRQAQELIDNTMNGISSKYQAQYDALINKQDNLIQKLKEAGDLFNISSANVMTLNDITEQTRAIKQYASKLATIKKKVSGALFDQIAEYDMKQGEAFIDRLLAMSDAELQAYSDAYDEKMNVAEQLSESIYKSDFDKVADEYDRAIQEAFAGLPAQLEALGISTMEGFITGLTENTDYMSEQIRTFVAGMVDQFKEQLGIHSPSKVTMKLGELVGEGFADGIADMVKVVKRAAEQITDVVSSELDFSGNMGLASSNILTDTVAGSRSVGTFGATSKTQVINFNQTNNSPKALDRLTLYRQTNNLLFSAKVGLSNV